MGVLLFLYLAALFAFLSVGVYYILNGSSTYTAQYIQWLQLLTKQLPLWTSVLLLWYTGLSKHRKSAHIAVLFAGVFVMCMGFIAKEWEYPSLHRQQIGVLDTQRSQEGIPQLLRYMKQSNQVLPETALEGLPFKKHLEAQMDNTLLTARRITKITPYNYYIEGFHLLAYQKFSGNPDFLISSPAAYAQKNGIRLIQGQVLSLASNRASPEKLPSTQFVPMLFPVSLWYHLHTSDTDVTASHFNLWEGAPYLWSLFRFPNSFPGATRLALDAIMYYVIFFIGLILFPSIGFAYSYYGPKGIRGILLTISFMSIAGVFGIIFYDLLWSLKLLMITWNI